MGADCLQQVGSAAVVKKKHPLTHAPLRSRAEHIWTSVPLNDAIRQIRAHVVQSKVRVGMIVDVGLPRVR